MGNTKGVNKRIGKKCNETCKRNITFAGGIIMEAAIPKNIRVIAEEMLKSDAV